MTPKTRPPQKKPYRSPRLAAYGDLRRLTAVSTKRGNMADGGGAKPNTRAAGPSA
jgi:hypothetical protein